MLSVSRTGLASIRSTSLCPGLSFLWGPIVLAFLASAVRESQGVSLQAILLSAGPAVQSQDLAVGHAGKVPLTLSPEIPRSDLTVPGQRLFLWPPLSRLQPPFLSFPLFQISIKVWPLGKGLCTSPHSGTGCSGPGPLLMLKCFRGVFNM